MPRKTNRQVKRVTEHQQDAAERFRYLLINYNTLEGDEQERFNTFINALDAVQLTNLSRQYRAPLDTYYDSQGVTTIIAQDVMKRVLHLMRQQASTISTAVTAAKLDIDAMAEAIFEDDNRKNTETVASKIFREYGRYRNLGVISFDEVDEVSQEQVIRDMSLLTSLYGRARGDEGRRFVLKAASGEELRISDREFMRIFKVGGSGVKEYRAIIPNTKG